MWPRAVQPNRRNRRTNREPSRSAISCGLADGRDAVLALFDRLHEESLAQFRALTPAMLMEKCATPAGTPLMTWKWLRMMPEHEIHHRGQISTMLSMLNVPTPPLYGLTAAEVQLRSQNCEVRTQKSDISI